MPHDFDCWIRVAIEIVVEAVGSFFAGEEEDAVGRGVEEPELAAAGHDFAFIHEFDRVDTVEHGSEAVGVLEESLLRLGRAEQIQFTQVDDPQFAIAGHPSFLFYHGDWAEAVEQGSFRLGGDLAGLHGLADRGPSGI